MKTVVTNGETGLPIILKVGMVEGIVAPLCSMALRVISAELQGMEKIRSMGWAIERG